jgi:alkylhydroperoxidase family enzyme
MPRVEPVPISPDGNAVTNSLLARVMGRCPDILNAFGGLDAAIRFHGRLPGDLYEAVRQATADQIGCEYCSSLGQLEQLDLGPEQVRTGLAVAFAQMVAEDPRAITDEQFAVLREEFSEEEIVELVAFISLVGIAGQLFGAVMGLEPTSSEEAAEYQQILARQQERRARSAAAEPAGDSRRP